MNVFSPRRPPRYDLPPPPPPRAPDPPARRRETELRLRHRSPVVGRRSPIRGRRSVRGSAHIQVLILLVPATIALLAAGFAWYRVAHTLETARPVKVPTIHAVSGVVWGGRVFDSRQALTAWLHSRGASYARWASRNPNLARVLESK